MVNIGTNPNTVAYPILQSGFIAMSLDGLKKPEPHDPSFRDAIIFNEERNPLAKYRFSPVVKTLYLQWCKDPELLRDFNFREKILKAAFSSFGTDNIYQWVVLQSSKPTMSDLHKTFIMETLHYLLTDSPRSIHLTSWIRLLEADDRPNSVAIDTTQYFQKEATNFSTSPKLPTSMIDLVQIWVGKEGGYEDLLVTLFTIFGDRSARSVVTKQTT